MEDLEQKISLQYDTNAETTAKEVNTLANSVDNVTDSQEKNTTATKKNEQELTSFKTQLRAANQELLKASQIYGETSQEAVKAAKKVADLKDQMGFAKDLVDKFNPDQKMKALTAATSLAGTAMTGVVSGMALFGDQSDDTAKVLLKVQSALAFSQAISGLSDVGDQFKILKTTLVTAFTAITTAKTADTLATEANAAAENQSFLAKAKNVVVNGAMAATTAVVTAAQWAWNTAMAANPIGAIVAVVVALIAAGYALVKMFQASSAEAEAAAAANTKLSNEIKAMSKSMAKSNEEMDVANKRSLGLAKAHGASSDAIRKLSLSLANQEIVEKKLNAEKARSIFLEARRVAGLEDATDAQKKTAEEAWKAFQEQNDNLKDAYKKRKEVVINNEIEVAQEQTDARKKALEDQKKHNEDLAKQADERRKKEAEERAKELKARQDFQKSISDLENTKSKELQDLNTKTELEKLNLQEERDLAEIMAIEKKGGDISELMKLHNEKFTILNEEYDQKEKDRQTKVDEENDAGTKANFEKAADAIDAKAKKELEIEQAVADGKKNIQQATIDTSDKAIALAKSLGIKSKEIQKGLLIAESASGLAKIVVSTQAANAADTAAAALMGPAGVSYLATKKVLNYTSAGIGAAANIAATAKALSALGGGSAGSSGSVGSSAGSSGSSSVPQVAFQNSNENQIATSIGGKINEQPPIKTYVTSGDVATALLLHNKAIDENKI